MHLPLPCTGKQCTAAGRLMECRRAHCLHSRPSLPAPFPCPPLRRPLQKPSWAAAVASSTSASGTPARCRPPAPPPLPPRSAPQEARVRHLPRWPRRCPSPLAGCARRFWRCGGRAVAFLARPSFCILAPWLAARVLGAHGPAAQVLPGAAPAGPFARCNPWHGSWPSACPFQLLNCKHLPALQAPGPAQNLPS